MPTYSMEIEYETKRSGKVNVNFHSSEDLSKNQMREFFESNATEEEVAETLEAADVQTKLGLTARIKTFKKLDKDHPQPDLDLDNYEIPEEE